MLFLIYDTWLLKTVKKDHELRMEAEREKKPRREVPWDRLKFLVGWVMSILEIDGLSEQGFRISIEFCIFRCQYCHSCIVFQLSSYRN